MILSPTLLCLSLEDLYGLFGYFSSEEDTELFIKVIG
jgi:hypothetical protein